MNADQSSLTILCNIATGLYVLLCRFWYIPVTLFIAIIVFILHFLKLLEEGLR